MGRRSTLVLLLTAATSSVGAQSPQWRQHSQLFLSSASGPALACDHLRDRIVAFGGLFLHAPVDYTFELDGDVWSQVFSLTPPPSPRWGCGMVFDTRHQECVLFGGTTSAGASAETWTWNGSAWTQHVPQNPPPGGLGTFCYDEARGVAVWYDGQGTYEWDGTNWLQRTSLHSPPQRAFMLATHDSRRGRTVVFGGLSGSSWYGDTWEWDGTDWQQAAVTFPMVPPPLPSSIAFDRERGRCLLICSSQPTSTTPPVPLCFEYDGVAWTPAPALPIDGANLVADRQRNRIVGVFGLLTGSAFPYSSTTWSYETPGLAIAQPYGIGCGTPQLAVHENPATRPVLGTTLSVDLSPIATNVAFMCFGWSNRQAMSLALPARMDAFGLSNCWLLQSDDAITLSCTPTGPTSARFDFPIPAWPSLTGLRFFLQPWAPAPGSNMAGVAIGDALAVTIGAF